MKRSLFNRVLLTLVILAVSPILTSFSVLRGGDSYTIQLGNKQVVKNYVHSKAETPALSLDSRAANEKLSVYYSECGKIGTERKLILKSDSKVLKEWAFANIDGENQPMICTVKEILAFKKDANLKLYYSSREVSKGQLLATISLTGDATVRK